MTALVAPTATVLGALTLAAGVCQLRRQLIPDWLTLGGMAIGFVLHVGVDGLGGLVAAGLGLGLALAIHLPLFAVRLAGTREVKLMAAVGALAGPRLFAWIVLVTAVLGGLQTLAMLVRGRRVRRTLGNLVLWLREAVSLKPPYRGQPETEMDGAAAVSVPSAVIVLLATAVVMMGQAWIGS